MQYDINLKIMGQRIKESRLKLGLTQEQLAEIVNLSVPHLSKVENGHKGLSLDTAAKLANALANALDFSIDYLVQESAGNSRRVFHSEMNYIVADCTEEELSKLLKLIRTCKEIIRE